MNVAISPYTSLVNWLQVPGTWTANPGSSTSITLNSSNDPTTDATLLFDLRLNQSFNGPDPNAVPPTLSGTYSLSFNGQATIEQEYPGFSTQFTVQNQVYNASTNTTTASLVVPATNNSQFFGIEFANTQATATSGTNTGFANAKLIRPGYAANSTQLYTNEFLAALKPYSVLRYLDSDNANGQPFFNGNTLVTVDAAQVDLTGVPWEYLVTLANETNTDMWINVPQGATDDYVTALAGIIKNGGTVDGETFAGLNSNLKVYVEYSNEVWGGIPFNEYYQEGAVQNTATNQPLSTFSGNTDIYDNPDGTTTTDVNTAMGRRYLERTAEIGQIFQSVMGADPTHQRIRPVLGWQEDNSNFYPAALNWYEHFFGSASSAFYGMGDANYVSPTDYSSVNAVISSLQAQEAAFSIPETTDFSTIATYFGLANVSYEGGPAIQADPTTAAGQVALAATRDPRMEQIVYQHYMNFFQDGGGIANYFDGPFGILTGEQNWPIAELSQYTNPSASARYQGTVDLANASPVTVTAGTAISATGTTVIPATTDTLGNSFATPNSGEQGYWLLNAASSGTDDLSLTSSAAGSSSAQFEVFLNDKEVGGLLTQSQNGNIDLGNLSLSSGLNTLSMVIVSSGSQFQPMAFTLTPKIGTFAISDAGFEAHSIPNGQFLYNPTGSSWTFAGSSGISNNQSGFTVGNPSAPQGSQVAFLQEQGTISQSVTNWAAGTYTIAFDAAQRGNYGGESEDFAVEVDGVIVGTFEPTGTSYEVDTTPSFTVSAGTHTIAFVGLDSVGGDNAALLDNISMATSLVPPTSPVAPPSTPTIGDAGFEAHSIPNGQFLYNPTGSSWTFAGSSGISNNQSGFTVGNPSAPQGSQVAFLQEQGTISQSVASWAAGTYTIAFDAAQRGNYGGESEDFAVEVDGVIVGTFEPTGTSYQSYTTPSFSVAAGAHTIAFVGLDSVGGDNTALLDEVSVATSSTPPPVPVPPSTPAIADAGFEANALPLGQFLYNATGSSWTFSGSSGISNNQSGFTVGNPSAPQGSQVAFLQEQGTISQSVASWAAGTYTIAFDAAQRGNYGGESEDFAVEVDGVIVGTFEPTGTSYEVDTTPSFTVSAGTHSIAFVGLDSVGGDNTVLLDDVTLSHKN